LRRMGGWGTGDVIVLAPFCPILRSVYGRDLLSSLAVLVMRVEEREDSAMNNGHGPTLALRRVFRVVDQIRE
jgi:hypothetical protein